LVIVNDVAEAWGAEPCDSGKAVWATLAVPTRLTEQLGCEHLLS
jgi:hypothetical protein